TPFTVWCSKISTTGWKWSLTARRARKARRRQRSGRRRQPNSFPAGPRALFVELRSRVTQGAGAFFGLRRWASGLGHGIMFFAFRLAERFHAVPRANSTQLAARVRFAASRGRLPVSIIVFIRARSSSIMVFGSHPSSEAMVYPFAPAGGL